MASILVACGSPAEKAQQVGESQQRLGLLDTSADLALGQLDLVHRGANIIDERGLALPGGVAVDLSILPTRLYVADTRNHRVLGYSDVDTYYPGAPADLVLGQVDFGDGECGSPSNSSLCLPTSIVVDSVGTVFVADSGSGGKRNIKSYNSAASKAPMLVIEYTP